MNLFDKESKCEKNIFWEGGVEGGGWVLGEVSDYF